MVVGTCTAHGTTLGRVGRNGNVVAIELEISHVCSGFRNFERTSRIGGYRLSALCPVHEGVALVGSGGQRNLGTIIVRACTVYCTASGRVGSGGDGKLVDSGLHSHKYIEGGHNEGVVVRINRDSHAATLCILEVPTGQMIVSIDIRCQGDSNTLGSLVRIDVK